MVAQYYVTFVGEQGRHPIHSELQLIVDELRKDPRIQGLRVMTMPQQVVSVLQNRRKAIRRQERHP